MLFISHKIEDKDVANEVLRRALEHGYSDNQIFFDSDPGSGIEAGTEWDRKIYESVKHTAGWPSFGRERVCHCFGVFGEAVLAPAPALLASKQWHGEFGRSAPCLPWCFALYDIRCFAPAKHVW